MKGWTTFAPLIAAEVTNVAIIELLQQQHPLFPEIDSLVLPVCQLTTLYLAQNALPISCLFIFSMIALNHPESHLYIACRQRSLQIPGEEEENEEMEFFQQRCA